MKKIFIYLLLTILTFNGFAKIKVITSIFPIADIVSNVVKDKAEVNFAIPVNANPHTFEPTPEQAKLIAQADVFIGISKEFDGWMEKFLKKDAKTYYLLKIPQNPHIWLSFQKGDLIIHQIRRFFKQIKKKKKKVYLTNAKSYAKKLKKIYIQYYNKFQKIKHKNIIQYHPAWEYLAMELNLKTIGIIYSGTMQRVSIGHLTEILNRGKKEGVDAILCSLNTKDKVIGIYEKELQTKRVELDPIGNPKSKDRNTYLKLLIYNCEKIYQALSQ